MYIIDTYLSEDRLPVIEKKELCQETQTLNSPETIFEFLNRYFRLKDRTEEYIYLLAFNKKCHLIGIFELSHGTVDGSLNRKAVCRGRMTNMLLEEFENRTNILSPESILM